MATVYALLTGQQDLELRECFIEGIDLASMKLHTLIPLGAGWPTAFAISGAQQRAYVADPSHSEVRVYDTAARSSEKSRSRVRPTTAR